MPADRRAGAGARPWTNLERRPSTARPATAEPNPRAEPERDARLPAETPFAGDDRDTLDLLRENAERRRRGRIRNRRVGSFVVFAVVVTACGAVIEHLLGVH